MRSQAAVSPNDNQRRPVPRRSWYTPCIWLLISGSSRWQPVSCFRTRHKAFQYVCKELAAPRLFLRSLRSQSKKAYSTLIEMPSRVATGFFLVSWQYLAVSVRLWTVHRAERGRVLTGTKSSWPDLTCFRYPSRRLVGWVPKHSSPLPTAGSTPPNVLWYVP